MSNTTHHDAGNAMAISAERIWLAIADTYADCNQDPQRLVAYALCDLRHLCDQHGLAFDQTDQAAKALYSEERQESA